MTRRTLRIARDVTAVVPTQPKRRSWTEYNADRKPLNLPSIVDRDEWIEDALCVGANPFLFDVTYNANGSASGAGPDSTPVPVSLEERDEHNRLAWQNYCQFCPVAQQCLDDALADKTRNGVYGGYQIWAEEAKWR
jgi:hypothetical protein